MSGNQLNVSVFGLGKLGAPIAAAIASRGFPTVGVDVDRHIVDAVLARKPPVVEPGLEELLAIPGLNLRATLDSRDAVSTTQVSFIIVPTPTQADGTFSLEHVLPVCEAIGNALAAKSDYHLVVLTSTVMPRETEGPVARALEKASRRRCGEDFGLCYSPEFVALGDVIRGFLNPDFISIGQWDERSGNTLESVYATLCENDPPIVRMSLLNAEITKLAVNTYVTTKITFANTLARLCERLPGADVDVVTAALGLDSRVGAKYLKGALGYGGPCFPRDNIAFAELARQTGAEAALIRAVDVVNREQVQRIAELVLSKTPRDGTVAILGLTYKPDTDVVDESQGLILARELASRGIRVLAYDPWGTGNARTVLGAKPGVRLCDSAIECVGPADVVVVATPWGIFKQFPLDVLRRQQSPRVLIDCWRIMDPAVYGDVVEYVPLGVGRTPTSGGTRAPGA